MSNAEKYISEMEKIPYVMEADKDRFEFLKKRIGETSFKIAVVGEFSSGKSTFINSIIGSDVLKHGTTDTTAAVTYIHNVKHGDDMENTVTVNYADGGCERLGDMSDLKTYTTTHSKLRVAEEISSVDIYVNFLSIYEDIIIVDTPGLNSMAEHHKEITMDEIQRSHACIYMLQLRGITETDIKFIKQILCYQNTIIFVQNFIDELKASEGETPEKKLNECRRIVEEKLGSGYNFFFCGISALYALAARDHNIKRLYRGSAADLTQSERLRLMRDSGFDEFLGLLMSVIKNEELDRLRDRDDCKALKQFIEDMLYQLRMGRERIMKMRSSDPGAENIRELKKIRQKINESKEERLKELCGFVDHEFLKETRELDTESRAKLEEIVDGFKTYIDGIKEYRRLIEEIDSQKLRRTVYDEADKFAGWLQKEKRTRSEYIYKCALGNMDSYNAGTKELQTIEFDETTIEKQDLVVESDRKKLSKMKTEEAMLRKKINEDAESMKNAENRLQNSKMKKERLRKRKKDIDNDYEKKMNDIGSQPEVETKYRTVERRVFLIFKKHETVPYKDDSKLREWDRMRQKIQKEYNACRAKVNEEIEKNSNEIYENMTKKEDLDRSIKKNKTELQAKQNDIERYEREIKLKEENIISTYTAKIKMTLNNDINKYFLGEDGFYDNVRECIKYDMSKNEEDIKKQLHDEYERRLNLFNRLLDAKIQGEEDTLDEIYNDNSSAIDRLEKILKSIEEEQSI